MAESSLQSRLRWVRGVAEQYAFRGVFGELPRLVYGNDAGFRENYRGQRELARLRAAAGPLPERDPRGLALERDGYFQVPDAHEPALLQTIASKYGDCINDPARSKPIGPRVAHAIRGIIDPLKHIPELEELLTPDIARIVRSYYGTPFRVLSLRLWRNVNVPPEYAKQDVFSNLWHNDPHTVTTMRLFVYLSNGVTRDTGALRFHSIANTKRIIRAGYIRRQAILPPARRLLNDPSLVMYFEGDLGATCLLNPQLCLHAASVPREGSHRDIVQFNLAPAEQPLSPSWARELPLDPDV